jgi:DeoR/GlpR family transcriptional regulator of sugar metabolism
MPLEVPTRRREQIAQYVQQAGFARIEDLAGRFGVSVMTIHRDLDALSSEGWLEKTRGGARHTAFHAQERNVALRWRLQAAEKKALARAALRHLSPGTTIALDDSTTVAALLPHLGDLRPMTLITNFLPAINAVADDPDVDLIALGGQFDRSLNSFAGPAVMDQLRLLSADVVVMSVAALHRGYVLHPSADSARLKRLFIDIGEKKILLADSTKFHRRATHRLVPVTVFDLVITDGATAPEHLQELTDAGVAVEVVEVTDDD